MVLDVSRILVPAISIVEVPYVIVEVPYVGLVARAVLCIRHSDGGTTTTHPYTHPPPPWSPPPRPST